MNNEPAAITQYDAATYVAKCKDLEELAELNTLLVHRMKTLRARAGREIAASLKVGDFVRFSNTIKPTYLQGRRARVTAFRQTKMTVELLDGPIGKFRSGIIIVPPSILTKIDAPRSFTTVDSDD